MTKQVRNKGFILGRVCARANMHAECIPAERFASIDLVLTLWPNGGLVYSSLDAPQRTTLPEMTWLSAVMSVRSKSAANSGGSRRAAAGKRRKGRGPKKGLRSRIRSCAIWHEAGLKACGLPVHTYRARGKGFMVFQTVNGPPKGVVKRQSPPRERWAESISKVRYAKQSPCFMLDPGIHQR